MDAICKNNAEAVKTCVTFPYVTLITENRTLWLLCRERKRAREFQWSTTMFHERRRHGELGLYTYCMHKACMWTIWYDLKVINIKKMSWETRTDFTVFLLWFYSVIKTQRTQFEGQKQQNLCTNLFLLSHFPYSPLSYGCRWLDEFMAYL